jgi:predicted transcriptional regulator
MDFKPKIKEILVSFSIPKTPRRVERDLCIRKLKVKSFIEQNLLISLNPEVHKGRLYTLTNRARTILQLSNHSEIEKNVDWNLVGWIAASPRQRLVVLKTISMDSIRRTSEQIRMRAARLNCRLSRISTKGVLNELTCKYLVKSELESRKRYYWISEKGEALAREVLKYDF